jgi:hypothetical protein
MRNARRDSLLAAPYADRRQAAIFVMIERHIREQNALAAPAAFLSPLSHG